MREAVTHFSGWILPVQKVGQNRPAKDFILEWIELFEPNEGV